MPTNTLLLLFFVHVCGYRPDITPWEILGLTSTEYAIAKNNNLSDDKIISILSVGVSIRKHLSSPWKRLNLTEKKWYDLIRSGMDSTQIWHYSQQKQEKHRFLKRLFRKREKIKNHL